MNQAAQRKDEEKCGGRRIAAGKVNVGLWTHFLRITQPLTQTQSYIEQRGNHSPMLIYKPCILILDILTCLTCSVAQCMWTRSTARIHRRIQSGNCGRKMRRSAAIGRRPAAVTAYNRLIAARRSRAGRSQTSRSFCSFYFLHKFCHCRRRRPTPALRRHVALQDILVDTVSMSPGRKRAPPTTEIKHIRPLPAHICPRK